MPLLTHFLPRPLAGSNVPTPRQRRMHTVPAPSRESEEPGVLKASGNKGGGRGGGQHPPLPVRGANVMHA